MQAEVMSESMLHIGASLADIVALMEAKAAKPDADKAEMLALLAALREAVANQKPPVVSVAAPAVTVSPSPVVVQADQVGQKWRVEIERAHNGPSAPISALVVTRL